MGGHGLRSDENIKPCLPLTFASFGKRNSFWFYHKDSNWTVKWNRASVGMWDLPPFSPRLKCHFAPLWIFIWMKQRDGAWDLFIILLLDFRFWASHTRLQFQTLIVTVVLICLFVCFGFSSPLKLCLKDSTSIIFLGLFSLASSPIITAGDLFLS